MRKIYLAIVTVLLISFSVQVFAGVQEDRLKFINKLIKQGIFLKVEVRGNLPHLWVKPKFHALDFATKQQFVNVVYAYYFTKDKKYDSVILIDSKTGKKIGVYTERYGGLKLY